MGKSKWLLVTASQDRRGTAGDRHFSLPKPFLLGRESRSLVACVAERLGFAKAAAAKGYASTTVNFLARAVDHFDIALHE